MYASSRAAIRVHDFLPVSVANGPGKRAVIWFQGCIQFCPGCFNPETHSHRGGRFMTVDDIVIRVQNLYRKGNITGFTISGGEPFLQAPGLSALLKEMRATVPDLSILLFTGFEWYRLQANPNYRMVLDLGMVDVVIAGPFKQKQILGQGLLGSANQTVHLLTDRHTLDEIQSVPDCEIIVDRGGLTVSGVNSLPASVRAELEWLGVQISA